MENPIKMDDLGCFPTIFGNTHMFLFLALSCEATQKQPKKPPPRGQLLLSHRSDFLMAALVVGGRGSEEGVTRIFGGLTVNSFTLGEGGYLKFDLT